MEPPGSQIIASILGLIGLGACFAAVDAGLSALGEVRLKAIRDAGEGQPPGHLNYMELRHAAQAARVLEHLNSIQARYLVGRVLCVTTAGALSAAAALRYDGVGGAVLAAAAVGIVYGVAAEAATAIARRRTSTAALTLVYWLRPVEYFFVPFAAPLSWIGGLVERWVPENDGAQADRIAELAVEQVIEDGEEAGSLAKDQVEMLRSVLEFHNTVVREVMVPRTSMVAFEVNTPIEKVLQVVQDEGHSRYPVYRERVDQIEGILYAKDLFKHLRRLQPVARLNLEHLVRGATLFAPETQKIGSVLREMQARRAHLAVVVDEFGGTSGIVTLEDLLEEIVGEIQDEHDQEQEAVREIGPGQFVVDAGASVYDLDDLLGGGLVQVEGEYDSLGGMLIELAGRVPQVGEMVSAGPFDIVVREGDERHVASVEVVRREVAALG